MALLSRRPGRWLRGLPWLLLRLGRAGGGRAVGTLSVWVWYERFTLRLWHVQPIRPNGMLLMSRSRHHGHPVRLADGALIRSGDPIIELHIDNTYTGELLATGRLTPWRVLRTMNADMQTLAERVAAGEFADACALHAVSLFADAAQRFGMEFRRLPRTPYWRLVRYFMVGLLVLHHPAGWERVAHLRESTWPGEIWMSRATLLSRVQR